MVIEVLLSRPRRFMYLAIFFYLIYKTSRYSFISHAGDGNWSAADGVGKAEILLTDAHLIKLFVKVE